MLELDQHFIQKKELISQRIVLSCREKKSCYFMIVPSRACSFNTSVTHISVLADFLRSPLEHKLPKGKDLISFFIIDSSEPRKVPSTL